MIDEPKTEVRARLDIVLYGARGNASSIGHELHAAEAPDIACDIVAFIDDFHGGPGALHDDRPLLTFEMWRRDYPRLPCLLTMGSPRVRRLLSDRARAAGGSFTAVHATTHASRRGVGSIGEGCFLGPLVAYGHAVSIGAHVQIYPRCSIGSDVAVGDFCTICPSCVICDHVILEESVFIGAGATIVGGTAARPLVVGAGAEIWAGSVVARSVSSGATIAGNPAAPLRDLARARRSTVARDVEPS